MTKQNTEIFDPAEDGARINWGGISIERAWVEYDVSPLLTIRAGQFLTPYGIWNVDHGSPVIIGIRRPWTIREQLFPERQIGLELHGLYGFGASRIGYHLTLSNGRVNPQEVFDTDNNKGVGGRATWSHFSDLRLTIATSFYLGSYTERIETWKPTDRKDVFALDRQISTQYDEWSLGADARLETGGWILQSEFVLNERRYREPGRPQALGASAALRPDSRRWGTYGLVGYRTPWHGVMPYFVSEFYNMSPGSYETTAGSLPHVVNLSGGLNVRPLPVLVVKLEGYWVTFPKAGADSWGAHNLYGVQGQVAWTF